MPTALVYIDPEAGPQASFKVPTTAPDVDPDEGAVVVIGLNPAWIPVVEGALDQLLLASTWKGTEDEILLALGRATNLKMLVGSADVGEVPAPFWDEDSGDDSDDQAAIDDQPWYGQIVLIDDELTFVENAFIYVVAGFIAYAGLPTAAVSFVPIARKFVVTMKSNPLGGIVRFLADATEIGRVDTYAAADGVISAPVVMPPPTMGFVAEDVSPTLWVELLEDNPHDLESVSMTLIRSRLSEADFSNPTVRYNPDTNQIEVTPDGGITWNPAPGSDPRHSTAFLKPPVGGSSKQCDAAANMVKWLKDFIDEMLFDFELVWSVTTIINSILLEFSFLGPYAELLSIISEVAETISGIGGTALGAAFTTDQYDLLTCIFYCRADTTGQVSAAALALIESDVTAQLNTTAALITNALLALQGEIGLSNAGSIGSETGDCTACACGWCYRIDLTVGLDVATIINGTFVSGFGVQVVTDTPDGDRRAGVKISVPSGTVVTRAEFGFNISVIGSDPLFSISANNNTVGLASGAMSTGAGSASRDGDFGFDDYDFYILPSRENDYSGDGFETYVQLSGTGDNPFGDNNC